MAQILKQGAQVNDPWTLLQPGDGETPAPVDLPPGDVLVPLAVWQARRAELLARPGRCGLILTGDDPFEEAAADLAHFAVIAVHFPKFADGRGYSLATLLRQRYGYRGELRAVGDVLHDQLFFLQRVGFDAFALRPEKDAAYALATGFTTFSERYQGASDQPLPLFRRRTA